MLLRYYQQPAADHRSIYKDAVFDTNEKDSFLHITLGNLLKSRAFTASPVLPAEL